MRVNPVVCSKNIFSTSFLTGSVVMIFFVAISTSSLIEVIIQGIRPTPICPGCAPGTCEIINGDLSVIVSGVSFIIFAITSSPVHNFITFTSLILFVICSLIVYLFVVLPNGFEPMLADRKSAVLTRLDDRSII